MTILKKLSIALTLALGIQFSAGAYFHEKDRKNAESALVLNFIQDLRNQNSTQAQEIATWLEHNAIREWGGTSYDVTWYPQSIVHIITNNSLTEKTKISLLSNMIAQEKRANRKHAIQQCVSDLCAGAVCLGVAALMTWAIIEDIKNPRPRVYYSQPQPSISITYTQKYPSWASPRYSCTYVWPY